MQIPADLHYTADHEWLRLEPDGTAYIGITDFAQSELGDIVYVEIETIGDILQANDIFGTIEAVKTTSELFLPVEAEVLEMNTALDTAPELVNTDPYGAGWLIKIKLSDTESVKTLMSASDYQAQIGG